MSEEIPMFEAIKNRIAERSKALQDERDARETMRTAVFGALGDAAPAGDEYTDRELANGVISLRKQVDDAATAATDLRNQRRDAYDAERKAKNRVDELEREKLEIAALLDLVPADPESDAPAVINEPADAAV